MKTFLDTDTDQDVLRKEIIEINNSEIPSSEKAVMIQRVMSRNHSKKKKNIESKPNTEFIGCIHFDRSFRVKSTCCAAWHACRSCHDQDSDHYMEK